MLWPRGKKPIKFGSGSVKTFSPLHVTRWEGLLALAGVCALWASFQLIMWPTFIHVHSECGYSYTDITNVLFLSSCFPCGRRLSLTRSWNAPIWPQIVLWRHSSVTNCLVCFKLTFWLFLWCCFCSMSRLYFLIFSHDSDFFCWFCTVARFVRARGKPQPVSSSIAASVRRAAPNPSEAS